MTTSLQPTASVVEPIAYRDEWVVRKADPIPNAVGATLSHKVWPTRLVVTPTGCYQLGTEGPPVFLVRWFNTHTGECLGEAWELAENLRLAETRGLPCLADVWKRTAADVVRGLARVAALAQERELVEGVLDARD